MKRPRHIFLFLAMALMAGGLTSCEDDPIGPDASEEEENPDETYQMPTEDVVTTLINHPVAVLQSGYDEVSERVIARMTSKTSSVTPDTKVVLMNGKDDFTITPEIWNSLKEVYDRGGVIMITNPDEGTRGWLEKSLEFNNTSKDPDGDGKPDWDGAPAGTSVLDMYAFTASGDDLELVDIYKPGPHSHEVQTVDSLGNTTIETVHHDGDEEPSQYQYGQFAESVAEWVNMVLTPDVPTARSRSGASRTGSEAEEYFSKGETDTKIMYITLYQASIYKDYFDKKNPLTAVTLPVTIKEHASAAYNFDDGCDYYYVEVTAQIQGSNIWKGIHKYHRAEMFTGWSQAGYAIDQIDIAHKLTAKDPDGLSAPTVEKYFPLNSDNKKTITTTRGWNLGAGVNLGLSKSDKWGKTGTGSFNFNHVNTTAVAETVSEMDVIYQSLVTDPDPKWQFTIPRFSLSGAGVGGLSDVLGYHDGKKPITISQVVCWKEKVNPGNEKQHILNLDFKLRHYMKKKHYGRPHILVDRVNAGDIEFTLPEPGRHKYNYTIQPVNIFDNNEWIQIMTILNDVKCYRDLKDFWKCSPRNGDVATADNAARQYFEEHYTELQTNCRRITNIKNTYVLALYNMTTGKTVPGCSLLIKPDGY